MNVCINCWNYKKKCKCGENRQITTIDDEIVDLICALNKKFVELNWDVRTKFCCAGHLVSKDKFTLPEVYIYFGGSIKYFEQIREGFEKLKHKNCTFRNEITELGLGLYCVGKNNQNLLSLDEKLDFLKGKVKFFDFLVKKIKTLKIC